MKFRHPLVLLLGGLLSASGIGCSAVTAVVSDSRPTAPQGRDTAGQMVAIARVFENQGRLSQAEMMYRKALKQRPNDAAIKDELNQLAERKNGKSFGSDPVKKAIARSDSAASAKAPIVASAPERPVRKQAQAAVVADTSVSKVQKSASSTNPRVTPKVAATSVSEAVLLGSQGISVAPRSQEVKPRLAPEPKHDVVSNENETPLISPVTTAAGVLNSNAGQVKAVSAESVSKPAAPSTQTVTVEEILAIVDTAADHSDLLLRGLRYGDSLEAQCLAATLLGDCSVDNDAVRSALETASRSAKDAYLRLAICDSRIQRNEHDASTAACLVSLVETGSLDIRIQACSGLRHFAGSESQSVCVKALEASLESDSPELRAAAAVTLGDFEQLSPTVVTRLISIARSDSSNEAREAARAATARYEGRTPETAMTLIPLGE